MDTEIKSNKVRYPYRTKLQRQLVDVVELGKWSLRLFPARRPDILKRRIVSSYAQRYGLDIFVESGTYLGATVEHLSGFCSVIYSVECQERLWRRAAEHFSQRPNIHILHGSGADLMPSILDKFDQPALFWLDGHFASGTTRSGEVACPTRTELGAILRHRSDHVILIDDADEFHGKAGYPSLDEIRKDALEAWPKSDLTVIHNIVRIVGEPSRDQEMSRKSCDPGPQR